MYPIGNNTRIEYVQNGNQYETNYARIGPFVTSYGRYLMARTLVNHKDDIVYIHTDSMITLKEMKDIKVGVAIGNWKCNFHKKVDIINKQKKIFFD
jgi:hypothetical protein